MITRRQVECEWYSPSDSDRAYPRGLSTRYDDCRKQWRGFLRHYPGRRRRWCGRSWHHGERLHLCLLQMPFGSGKSATVITHSSDRTHVKDLKNLIEVRPPGVDRLFITLRVETPRDHIPFAPLDQLPLDICHYPTIKYILYQWTVRNACRRLDSRRQLVCRIVHGLTGLVRFLPIRLPVGCSADIGTK